MRAQLETLGKLEKSDAAALIGPLLNDPDPFVARNAIEALHRLKAPAPPDLGGLVEIRPDLLGPLTTYLLEVGAEPSIQLLVSIYEKTTSPGRGAILDILADPDEHRTAHPAGLQPMFEKASLDPDVDIRRRAAKALTAYATALDAELLDRFLADEDAEVRLCAAATAVTVAAIHYGCSQSPDRPEFGVLKPGPPPDRSASGWLGKLASTLLQALGSGSGEVAPPADTENKTEPRQTVERTHARWRLRLEALAANEKSPLRFALAAYALGDGRQGLDRLAPLLARPEAVAELNLIPADCGWRILAARVPWPEAGQLRQALSQTPEAFAKLFGFANLAAGPGQALWTASAPLIQNLRAEKLAELEPILDVLLESDGQAQSLFRSHPTNRSLLAALARAQDPLPRALAYFAAAKDFPLPAREPDPWVRYAALQAWLAISPRAPEERERDLLPRLDDPQPEVAKLAALGLLRPPLGKILGLYNLLCEFRFGDYRHYAQFRANQLDRGDSPPTISPQPPHEPTLIPRLRTLLEKTEDRQLRAGLAVLLAQYGDPAPLDQALQGGDEELAPLLMTAGLKLTRDPKYLGIVRLRLEQAQDQADVKRNLDDLEGLPGEEARELRREINRRLRTM